MIYKYKYILILSLLLVCLSSQAALAYWMWTPQTKRWVNPKYAPKDTPKEQFLYAMDFFEMRSYKKALTEFRKIIKYYKKSEAASEAQYYIGRCYENLENPYHAFEVYQKVIDDYPFTQRTSEIIERQFNIGEKLRQGEKTKFLGVSFRALPEQIIEVYKKVVSNAPYGKYAPQAQYYIGELNKKIGFYEDAMEAFQKVVEDYPNSDIAQQAKFQVAICAGAASGKSGYDQRLTEEAIEEFGEFVKSHPDSELAMQAEEERDELVNKKAESYLKTGNFYERIKKYKSASLYYNKVLDEFPESAVAPEALARLRVVDKRIKKR